MSSPTWIVYEFDGYRYGYHSEVEAPSQKKARQLAAIALGGEYLGSVPGKPKRKFRVSKRAD